MSNSTVPAAATGLPTLNRRSALGKIGLGLASTASLATASAIAAPTAGVSQELTRLIEAHRAAFSADKEALDRHSATETIYIQTRPPGFSFYDMYGPAPGNRLGSFLGREGCKQRMRDNIEYQSRFNKQMRDYATPKRLKQLLTANRAIERDVCRSIDAHFDADDEARRSSGFEAAELVCRRTSLAEYKALAALCSHRCATVAEMGLKGRYLGSLGADAITEDHIEALLKSASADADVAA